jgi:integrase
LEFTQPKTARSRRNVSLTAVAVDALRRHRVRQSAERLAIGPAWEEMDLVFANMLGGLLLKSNVLYRSFKPLLRKAGLPPIRFHDLRHTAATLMLLQGVHPKVVSEMLGHASVSITLDLYSHVLPNMQKDAIRRMNELFGVASS